MLFKTREEINLATAESLFQDSIIKQPIWNKNIEHIQPFSRDALLMYVDTIAQILGYLIYVPETKDRLFLTDRPLKVYFGLDPVYVENASRRKSITSRFPASSIVVNRAALETLMQAATYEALEFNKSTSLGLIVDHSPTVLVTTTRADLYNTLSFIDPEHGSVCASICIEYWALPAYPSPLSKAPEMFVRVDFLDSYWDYSIEDGFLVFTYLEKRAFNP